LIREQILAAGVPISGKIIYQSCTRMYQCWRSYIMILGRLQEK
jgi:hypothetical protein